MKKRIAIIGGNYLQLPLVQKAQAMGIEVHCFAWEDGAVCKGIADYFYPISIREKETILQKCIEIGIDGITSIASDLAVLTVNYVADKMGLIGNRDMYSRIQTNKYLMRRCFDVAGVPSPRYCLVDSNDKLPELDDWQWPLIVKPTDRSGSRAVLKVDSYEQMCSAVNDAINVSFANEAIIEEFITGVEVSVESISWRGRHYVLQITDKVTTDKHFVEIAHHQPSMLSEIVKEKIRETVKKALTAIHIEYGASHSEIKITPSGDLYIMEIGARMGGAFIGSHLVPLSTGYDFMKSVICLSLGIFEEPVLMFNKCSGVLFLVEETKYLKDVIDNASHYPEIVYSGRNEQDIRPAISNSDRTGYVIYQSNHRIEHF